MSTQWLNRRLMLARAALLLGLAGSRGSRAAGAVQQRAGVLDYVAGDASVLDAEGARKAVKGLDVYSGQALVTGVDAEVHLIFEDGGFLALRSNSKVVLDQVKITGALDDDLTMTLLRGALRSITGWVGKFNKSSYRLNVGTATVGIRGTDHELALVDEESTQADDDETGIYHWVNEGATTLRGPEGEVNVEAGQVAWQGILEKHPRLRPFKPRFLARFRSTREDAIGRYANDIRQHIERRLRRRGLLGADEPFEAALERHQRLRDAVRGRHRRHRND